MSQTYKCDVPGCNNEADILMSNLRNGDTQALCLIHYNECTLALAEEIKKGIELRKKQNEERNKAKEKSKAKEPEVMKSVTKTSDIKSPENGGSKDES